VPAAAAGLSPLAWFARLMDDDVFHEAALFLAHALPRYECVLWGAQALMAMGAADRQDPLMVAVLRWIDQPGDGLRREAGRIADEARRDSPARMLAAGVMMSGGTISDPDYAPILPPPGACALYVAGAVMAGAALGGAYGDRMRQALERGAAIAAGQ
jgi:hypothetical protein